MPPRDAAVIAPSFEIGGQTTYNRRLTPAKQLPWMDSFFKHLTRFFAFFVFSILAAILVSLVFHSQLALSKFGFNFLFDPEWNPVTQEIGKASCRERV